MRWVKYLVLVFWLAVAARSASAAAPNCEDPTAAWNQADGVYQPGATNNGYFYCTNSQLSPDSYTFLHCDNINNPSQCAYTCPNGNGRWCVRRADCAEVFGTEGFACLDFSNSLYDRNAYDCKPFHCPGDNQIACCRPKPDQPPPGNSTSSANQPTAPALPGSTNPGINLSLNNCCQQIVPPLDQHTGADYGLNHLVQLVINVYKCILCVVGALMLLMIIIGGVTMIMSAGDKGKVSAGKKIITAAVVGGVIVFASYLIINFAVKALGGSFNNEKRLEINPGADTTVQP